ncbi:MAG: two pore domain potassium channel family protein [Boseongicola sp. SB0676_bin_33]|uniref:Two pore domain potassium channel family protein n=1 Tax=Boseongicola sp. SB0664_bin_43 TaxID=2604844 RepID=A0A6B0XYR2_9RHOB|nr:two pore domain potassium channel family protein [Boseongicola sp. SB0664_bin_43]MYF89260.1 two pore domain potassium channel family protein [Boseongicola sp. SB0676_bin_33]
MKRLSPIVRLYLAYCVLWPLGLLVFLDDPPKAWELAFMQGSLFAMLLGACVELGAARSQKALLLLLVLAVLAGISTHALYYTQLGLVRTDKDLVVYPSWSDALYFSVVTFTTLGYGDLAPREEYRLVAAFQAIYGYVFLGAFVGTLVTVFNAAPRAPRR